MICAVAYAFHILVLGRFAAQSSVAIMSVVQIATAALLGAATFWWAEPVRVTWTPAVILALAITSVLATALAFPSRPGPSNTAVPLAPRSSSPWNRFSPGLRPMSAGGEILSARAIAGAALILAGIVMVELKPFRKSLRTGALSST